MRVIKQTELEPKDQERGDKKDQGSERDTQIFADELRPDDGASDDSGDGKGEG